MIIVAFLIAIAIPMAVLTWIYFLDKYRTGEFKLVVVCFVVGVLAYFLAAQINPATTDLGWVNDNQMVRFVAPVVEELLKAAVLFILVRRAKFTYFVDGAIYGFTIGIGFAIAENFEYILGYSNVAMAVAVNRVISTNLMHAAATATTGIVLGWARFRKPSQRLILNLVAVLPAIALHMAYNNLVTRVESGWLLVYAVVVGGGAVGLTALLIRRGLKEEESWIKEKLGEPDRVEREEARAAQKIDKLDAVLKRLAETFGDGTAKQIEKLLLIQARLGILRKTVEKMSDEKMRAGIQAQIDELRIEMERERKQIGSYAMVYLRYTHLEEIFSVYAALESRIKDLAAQPHAPGMGVFDRLKEHVVTSPQESGGTTNGPDGGS
jgi:RsiW-degrading membrane proteinase PrsW (M82 family)